MRVKHFLIPALLSIGACLAIGNLAHAQHGGHGGGGHAGGGHMGGGGMHMGGGGVHMGGHPGYGYGGGRTIIYGGGYGLGGLGYGYGGFGYGGLGYGGLGYGYGSGLGYGYGNVYSPYYNGAVAPQYSYYATPSTAQAAGPDAVALPAGAAQIRVILPDPNAKVFFDGAATQQTGTDRYYHTPDLAPGGNYSYRIRATWGTDAQEVVVTVAPGGAATADFRPRSEAVPTPKK